MDRATPAAQRGSLVIGCLLLGGIAAIWCRPQASPEPEAPDDVLRRALAAYRAGDWEEAARGFHAASEQRLASPDVLLYEGNAWVRTGRLGNAILSYERALRLRPRDTAIRTNLRLARLATADQFVVPAPSRAHAAFKRLTSSLTLDEAVLAATGFYWALCFALAGRLASGGPRMRGPLAALAICFALGLCASGLVAAAKSWEMRHSREAIVLVPEVAVRAGPGEGFDTLFTVHDGARLRLGTRQGIWQEVSIPTGASGWVRTDAFEEI